MASVSVVIPAYNCGKLIARTLRAALAQRTAEICVEVIVVDDGSSDDTSKVIEQYADQVRYVRQDNSGVSSARNAGLALAKGDFVCFLDADDVLRPGWFAEAVQLLGVNPEVGVIFGRFWRWMAGPEEDPQHAWCNIDVSPEPAWPLTAQELSGWIYHCMLIDSWILCSAALVRREVACQVGGFEVGIPMGEDWSFWIRVSRACPALHVSKVVVLYRQHPNQASRGVHQINYGGRVIESALAKWGLSGPGGAIARRSDVDATLARLNFWYARAHFDRGSFAAGLRAALKAARCRLWHQDNLRLLLLALFRLFRPQTWFVLLVRRRPVNRRVSN